MAKQTKRQRQADQILFHGLKLKRLFGLEDVGPVTLCKQLHRLEARVHRYAEDYCNGYVSPSDDEYDRMLDSFLRSLDKITGYQAKGIACEINMDPRGHALKISDAWMREHPECDIPRDWGGYGILAPEFTGEE